MRGGRGRGDDRVRTGTQDAAPGGPASSDDDARVLRAARRGDGAAVASLYDRHAGALYSLACWVLGEGRHAEEAVVGVVVDACAPDRDAGLDPTRPVREELARLTWERCAATRPPTRAARARGVLGLCLHGGLPQARAARVVGLPGVDLRALLRAGMAERGLARPA